jgi:hypothetical protein
MNTTTNTFKGRRVIAAALLATASSAVAITAISSMPAANAQTLFRNTPSQQMEDCVINATKIMIPGSDYTALRANCCASLGGKWYPPSGGNYAGSCDLPDGSTWFGRDKTPPANSTVILPPGTTNTYIN